jgi:fructose/tagatose bisphosphate aldolase
MSSSAITATIAHSRINFERVEAIVARRPTPIVLHGGKGLSRDTFKKLVAAGAGKSGEDRYRAVPEAD